MLLFTGDVAFDGIPLRKGSDGGAERVADQAEAVGRALSRHSQPSGVIATHGDCIEAMHRDTLSRLPMAAHSAWLTRPKRYAERLAQKALTAT